MSVILPIVLGVIFLIATFYFVLVMPILSLVELSKAEIPASGKKFIWLLLIILIWPLASAAYLIRHGSRPYLRVSGKFFFVFLVLFASSGVILFGSFKPKMAEILQTDANSIELRNRPLLTAETKKKWMEKLNQLSEETRTIPIYELESLRVNYDLHEFFNQLAQNEDLNDQDFNDWLVLFEARKEKTHADIKSYLDLYKRKVPELTDYNSYPVSPGRTNIKLSIGENYLGTEEPMSIPLNRSIELDGKTRNEVKEIRTEHIKAIEPYLKSTDYKPSETVFGQIFDFKPWHGEIGALIYGPGEKISEGNSELSTSMVNPLVLFWPSFKFDFKDSNRSWNEAKLKADSLLKKSSDFPLVVFPSKFLWYPKSRKAVLQIDASLYQETLKKYLNGDMESLTWNLNFNSTNAVDFGFNYWLLNESKSTNVRAELQSKIPLRTAQFFQTMRDCHVGDGCNSLSPVEPELNSIKLSSFPATIQFDLWNEFDQKKPTQPDLSFIIDFQTNVQNAIHSDNDNPPKETVQPKESPAAVAEIKTAKPEPKVEELKPEAIAAAVKGELKGLEELLKKGLDLNAKGRNGMRLIHFAATYGQNGIVQFLLDHGADLNAEDLDRSMAIHYAAYKGNGETLKLLISKGAKLNTIDKEGLSPLGYAKLSKNEEKIKILQDAGAK